MNNVNTIYKISAGLHLLSVIMCIVIGLSVPIEDHLRWNLGYMQVWLVFITALIALATLPTVIRARRIIQGYFMFVLFSPVLVLIISFFLGILGFIIMLLVCMTFVPQTKIADNAQYVLREAPLAMRRTGSHLYKKSGLLEQFVGELDPECPPVSSNEKKEESIKSFHVDNQKVYITYDAGNGNDSVKVISIVRFREDTDEK